MKMIWCWRCRVEVPMLDEEEFDHVFSLKQNGKDGDLWNKVFGPVLAEYERITGVRETNINALYHHRISYYGPPCAFCSRPLRTPRAKFCGNCMQPVTQ